MTRLDSAGAQVTRTEFGYDDLGRITSETDARTGATTLTWYDDDQIASITAPDPGDSSGTQTTAFTYDAAGRIDLTTLPDNGVVDRNHFPTGDLQSESGARTYPVSYTYDPQGRMRTLTTAGGVTTWTYHPESGRLEQKIHGDGHGPAYAYSPAGRPVTRVSGRGITTTYGFDNGGALAGIDYSDATPDVIYTQTRRGQVATTYTYNLAGQGESETITGGILDGVVIDPGHDALLRRSTLNAGGAGWTYHHTYGFDNASRLNAIGFGDHSFSYGYLPNSNLIQTAGNDVLTTTKTWGNLNRLHRIQSTSAATAGGLSQTFT